VELIERGDSFSEHVEHSERSAPVTGFMFTEFNNDVTVLVSDGGYIQYSYRHPLIMDTSDAAELARLNITV